MPYNVYTIESLGNGERNHKAIYIETNPIATSQSVKGNLYHVTGTILKGMAYDPRSTTDPELLPEYIQGTKKQIATIAEDDLARFETECCLTVSPPKAQVTLSGKKVFPQTSLYRCREWIADVEKVAVEKGIFTPYGNSGAVADGTSLT
ncbi:hypothetical protein PENDEC_c004G03098 [Penicillium decumbens]|uniref:Uncharacterized protein n=1 Tax=Penicillium decumbens TaxID=69771 RepID=A0A1V6PI18_PENDC|nr:hypothetical protein PENDEC_c004G03098 [Penicillium decumbens]